MNEKIEKIWSGGASEDTGNDITDIMTVEDTIKDSLLLDYEVLSLLAYHIQIYKQSLIPEEDSRSILKSLLSLLQKNVVINPEFEDVHGYVEAMVGEISGKPFENLRIFLSRNEQSHTNIRMFQADHLLNVSRLTLKIAETTHEKGMESSGSIPGHTHYRQAMPVAIRTYYDYIASVMVALSQETLELANSLMEESPFGYGSGFGSMSPVDFTAVVQSLGFERHMGNPIYGSFLRGMDDLGVLYVLEKAMISISRIAQDMIIYSSGEHPFIKLPDGFTTGSSLMANKRNPDFLEMIQGYSSMAIAGHTATASILGNKSSGYHRELQISKDRTMDSLLMCEKIFRHFNTFLSQVIVEEKEGKVAMENDIYATGEAYRIFSSGKTWKESYRKVGDMIRSGQKFNTYEPPIYEFVNKKILDEASEAIENFANTIRKNREAIVETAQRLA
jgi:argininosuccinate lyase